MLDTEFLIIGAGFGGIGMAIKLKQQGHNCITLWEKESDLGGCWRDNHYPGAACDVPSHLYSYSFAPNSQWSHKFAPQQEIYDYIKDCADRFKITEHIHFNKEVSEARYDSENNLWRVTDTQGNELRCRYLITATGQLNRPAYPGIAGLESFKGEQFHSARWNHDVDLKDKNVAVIGTGASAIQFVPSVVNKAKHVTLFQRSAPYVIPKPDRPYSKFERWAFKRIPGLLKLSRLKTYLQFEVRFLAFRDLQFLLKPYIAYWRRFMNKQVKDEGKRKKLTPDYIIGCKRILIANNYYPAIDQDHVDLVDSGIAEVTPSGITDKQGNQHDVDVIILATGFKATDFLSPIKIYGQDGISLNNAWKDGAEAYLGMCVNGFPNCFMLYGPNTNLGHSSIIYMLESQINFILKAIDYAKRHDTKTLNVKADIQSKYNDTLQRKIHASVWDQGCTSWYKNESGKNTNNWSGFTLSYRRLTKHFKAKDFATNE
ncbi:NAD(P)/FAD-dependent oxidoreductase [Bermanella marisrubri]|uniref:Probable flavin-binding monooxygenase n=1 Tax=Bermanella marisrubri TaxID=207949 RepID=Q1N6R8_9GAMM|nr:NAD(P)/FAD-dependent oxidoreductase [Bermanella marisrubri]EAT13524.1 probable flavin-binding monooxygenase [Oceanobacter sp. RED65] [Bermanella marisrubri]QIZ84324.1 NAD(P)/FAD-dependent oxidoreductase [Bermanella marisrubri]